MHQNGQEKCEEPKNIMEIDWKKFEQNNKATALNMLHVPHNKEEIGVAYRSKYNCEPKKQVVLLMITDGEKSHYLALKNILTAGGYRGPVISLLSRLLNGISSNHSGDFYCLG